MTPEHTETWLRAILRQPGSPGDPDQPEASLASVYAGARYVLACLADPKCTEGDEVLEGILAERLGVIVTRRPAAMATSSDGR